VRADVDPVRAIADAVLYEGYMLWPYRRSALKNQRRFTFGGVFPPAHHDAHPDDPASLRAEVLLTGSDQASVQVSVRFLQVVDRAVASVHDGALELVDELVLGAERFLAWEEAVEREIQAPALTLERLRVGHTVPIMLEAGGEHEELHGGAGALIRTWKELRGELAVSASPLPGGAWRLRVRIDHATRVRTTTRQRALEHTFCSMHVLLRVSAGRFVSLIDPPAELAEAAAACRNLGLWPVLVGEHTDGNAMLASPIILEDHPRIAAESPGDLFDGGEIDQLLILNILTLTDEEKAEMAASDPRTREILERTEALTPEQLMALHGTVREIGMAR
jgi:hypothetical protein